MAKLFFKYKKSIIFAPFWTTHLPCPSVPLLIQYSKDVYHYERIMNTDYYYEPAKEILL